MGQSSNGLWRHILIHKYKLGNDGWSVMAQVCKIFGLWKSILSVKGDFDPWARFRVHDGHRVTFWHYVRCGHLVL